jgi:hypothetical protein
LGELTEESINFRGNGGGIDESDYAVWKQHFGASVGEGSGGFRAAVPEPTVCMLVLPLIFASAASRRIFGRSF